VVHAHPPTLVGCAPADLILVFTHLSRLFWSANPWLSIFVMGEELAESMSALAGTCQAVVVKNHGVFAWEPTIMEAYAKIE